VFVLIVGVVALVGKLVEGALLRERIRVRLEHLAEGRVAKLLLRHGGDGGRHLDSLYLVVALRCGGFAAGFVIFGLGFTMGGSGLTTIVRALGSLTLRFCRLVDCGAAPRDCWMTGVTRFGWVNKGPSRKRQLDMNSPAE
jgi:hypothetical protein